MSCTYVEIVPTQPELVGAQWLNKPGLFIGHVFDTEPCPIDNAPNYTCT